MGFWDSFLKIFSGTIERNSPSDFVPRESIAFNLETSRLEIDMMHLNIPLTELPDIWMPDIPNTNSMDPVFDSGNTNILIKGANEADHQRLINFLKLGDIAVYRIPADFSQPAKIYAIHRIVEIGKDNTGRYFKFKGDNNPTSDGYKARDSNIIYINIGTIY